MKKMSEHGTHRGGVVVPPYVIFFIFSLYRFLTIRLYFFHVGCACRTRGAGVGPLRKNGASPHRPPRGEQAEPTEKKKAEQGKNKKAGQQANYFRCNPQSL